MRRDIRWGRRALVMAVLTVAVGLSERAQAQQTGLFPLATIRRERPPCPNEDPVYKYYKQQYFGYHYTCWQPFPAGWGCPSKQTADKEKEFQERPLGQDEEKERERGEEGSDDQRTARPRPAPRGDVEVPQGGRDPFEMDPGGPAPLPPGGGQNPRPRQSPFEGVPQGASTSPRGGTRARTVTPGQGDDAPELSAPAGQPNQNTSARSTDGEAVVAGDTAPVLDVENLGSPRPEDNASFVETQPIQVGPPPAASGSTLQAAPQRRGLISNLFGSLGLNWMRR